MRVRKRWRCSSLREVQEDLDDAVAVVGQVALPVVDLAEAALPDVALAGAGWQLLAGQDLRVHAHHEHLLVVGAVEDADVAARRQATGIAPQVVVVELLRRGHLEAVHLHALRVDAAHDVADGAVLAGRVHGLEADQQRIGVLRRQPLLVLGQQLHASGQDVLRLVLAVLACLDGSKSWGRRTRRPGLTRKGAVNSATRFGVISAICPASLVTVDRVHSVSLAGDPMPPAKPP